MKKFALLAAMLCLLLTICASAKSGDIAGKYYSTDIVTTLNGVEIDSINIGGQTLISAEDMYYYAFNVAWNATDRTLRVNSIDHATRGIPPAVKKSNRPSGSVLGYYYETDIVTYLDSKPITAYNLGGRTYIHAEAMRDFGYEVIWNAEERSLAITSLNRTPYYYSISLAEGVDQNGDYSVGDGNLSVTYTKDGVKATGDANCLDMTLWCRGDVYRISINHYQNYKYTRAIHWLDRVTYYGMESAPHCEPSELYDEVNKLVTISINGHVAKEVAVTCGGGNGHIDYYLTVSDLPKFAKDEIEELYISIGEAQGEPYEMALPRHDVSAKKTAMLAPLLKYPNDYVDNTRETDDYYIAFVCESEQLGAIKDRLYVVNRKTGEYSEDIFDKIRALEGFDYDTFSVNDYRIDAENNYFRFSLYFKTKIADFGLKLDDATVELLSERAR